MRLIKADSLTIEEFVDANAAPPYAILSHTWGEEECSLRDVREGVAPIMKGFAKIRFCCDQALQDGLAWAWVDTCCIDKTSSAELSEAINSMFKWYRNAAKCYAYLSDALSGDEIFNSRWFTRGWTLQELIAPNEVTFYSSSWTSLGTKHSMSSRIHHVTGIDEQVLMDGDMTGVLNAVKMSWASQRQTTRLEDHAYCLLGIFNINMPLLYGEGEKAFVRLQQAILTECTEFSLLAWGIPLKLVCGLSNAQLQELDEFRPQLHGPFADSSADFRLARGITPIPHHEHWLNLIVQRAGVEATFDVRQIESSDWIIAKLPFTLQSRQDHYLCLLLFKRGAEVWARARHLIMIHMNISLTEAFAGVPWIERHIRIAPTAQVVRSIPMQSQVNLQIKKAVDAARRHSYQLEVRCFPGTTYNDITARMTINNGGPPGLLAVLFFNASNWKPPHGGHFAILIHKSTDDLLEGMGLNHISVLRPDTAAQDFNHLLKLQSTLVKYCGTKAQIEAALCPTSTIHKEIVSGEPRRGYHAVLRNEYDYTLLSSWAVGDQYASAGGSSWVETGFDSELSVRIEFVSRTLLEKEVVLHCNLTEQPWSKYGEEASSA